MSKIDIRLGQLGPDAAVFHDLRYANDRYGGNQNETKLEIRNVSGNTLDVQIGFNEQDANTGKWQYKWRSLTGVDGVRIRISGACENTEFLRMLQLILETEKMVDIIKP